ncbi:MAG: hypothetical protein KME31_15220 [Tolypothrix carrinoi HA7290-LM1]|nr:hypothetical protein [Tolypothrix carrinoi HA7290-LM1]
MKAYAKLRHSALLGTLKTGSLKDSAEQTESCSSDTCGTRGKAIARQIVEQTHNDIEILFA